MAEFVHSSMVAAGLVSEESMAVSEQESIETGCYGCITAVQINNEKVFSYPSLPQALSFPLSHELNFYIEFCFY